MSADSVARLRAGLDAAVFGQTEAKRGLCLALIAREHAYLEGPPGCAKTALAHALGVASGAATEVIAFHRETREADLVGDPIVRRVRTASGERLERSVEPGRLLGAEVAILDDISRAPGEALGTLGPLLGARRLAGRALPLETAIATALSPEIDAYCDPLEGGLLDRFAVQVRLRGHVGARDWNGARALLDAEATATPGITRDERRALQRAAASIPIEHDTRVVWLRLIERLRAAADDPRVLTDRSLGAFAANLVRAHALIAGRARAAPADLAALRWMLARRLPPEIAARFDEVLEASTHGIESSDGLAVPGTATPGAAAGARGGAPSEAREVAPLDRGDRPLENARRASSPTDRPIDVDPLLRAIEGRLERGTVDRADDPGGSPRGRRRMRRLDEILDADALDAQLLVEGRAVEPPSDAAASRWRGAVCAVPARLRNPRESRRTGQWARRPPDPGSRDPAALLRPAVTSASLPGSTAFRATPDGTASSPRDAPGRPGEH